MVVSYGADGDFRELCAMQTTTQLACGNSIHRYHPISTYLCTLSLPCFDSVPAEIDDQSIIAHQTDQSQTRLAMSQHVQLNSSIIIIVCSASV